MKTAAYFMLIIISTCLGLGYYAVHHGLIIIQLPLKGGESNATSSVIKKNVVLYYWYQGQFRQEPISIIVSSNKDEMLSYLITNWLHILEQASQLPKKVALETVLLSASGTDAYISFTRTLFSKQEATFEKWMRLEGLFKTIRASHLDIARISVLVHHVPLSDVHLDFSCPWPIHGFIE